MSVKTAAHKKRKQPLGVYMRRYWPLYAMLLLPTAFCLLFKYWPMTGLVMAFKNFKMMRGIWGSAWNGLDNFTYLFSRAESVTVILQTLKLNLLDLLFGFSMPIILSLLLNEVRSKAFKRITQTVIYLPHFLSWVIIASLFIMLLRTETGMVNIISANMGGQKIPYLEDNFLWQVVYIFIGVWQSMGWGTIIYLAAITGISAELYEAATVDGAGRFAKIWHVTLPGIRGTIVTLLIMNLGGDYTIPATQNLPSTTGMRADSCRTGHTDPREIAIYSDLQVVSLDWEPIKKNYKVLNIMYNEGLISKEFALDADGSQAKSDFVNGKAGVYGFYLSSNSDVISTLMANCPDAKLAILDARSGVPAGETLYDYQADPIGISTGITAYCEHPEAVMMYINWMAQPEVLEYLEYGEEGKHYNVVNGLKVLNSEYDGPDRFVSTNANIDLFVMVSQTRRDAVSLEAMSATYCPNGFEYLMEQIFENNANKTYIRNYRFTTPMESQAEYGEDLRARFQAISAQVITCPADQFDALYDELVKDYCAAGLDEIHAEKAQVYDAEN